VSNMTKLLSISPKPDASIACDMTAATDTLAERLAEYRRLFEHALVVRESTEEATVFRFAARPGVREWVCDLAEREAACCSFLAYEIDEEGDEIVWRTSGGLGDSEMAVLDRFLDVPGSVAGDSDAIARELENHGLPVIEPNGRGPQPFRQA
jgi:hypothetical protein